MSRPLKKRFSKPFALLWRFFRICIMFILVCQGRMRPSTFPIHNFYLRHGRPGDQSPGPGRVTPDCPREVAAGSWTQKLKLNFSVPFYSLERNDASDPGRILLMSEVWAAQTCWAWGRQRPWSTSSCPACTGYCRARVGSIHAVGIRVTVRWRPGLPWWATATDASVVSRLGDREAWLRARRQPLPMARILVT